MRPGRVSQWYPGNQPGSLLTHFTIISNESEDEGLMHLGGGLHLSQRRLSREETSHISFNKTNKEILDTYNSNKSSNIITHDDGPHSAGAVRRDLGGPE